MIIFQHSGIIRFPVKAARNSKRMPNWQIYNLALKKSSDHRRRLIRCFNFPKDEVETRCFNFVQRLLNYCPNYSTRRLYFGEVETPYLVQPYPDTISNELQTCSLSRIYKSLQ